MNREQKIALIIGFAVILVVGVLVSDHWSQARRVELADATEGVGEVLQGQPVAMLAAPDPVAPEQYAMVHEPVAEDPPPPVVAPQSQPSIDVLNIHQGGTNSALADALQQAGPAAGAPEPTKPWYDNFSRLTESLGGGKGLREAARIEENGAKGAPGAPAGTEPPHSAPVVRHTVQKNESLFGIAKQYYGDGSKWRKIAEANSGLVKADGRIEPGMTLTIPDAGSRKAAGRVGDSPEGKSGRESSPSAKPEKQPASQESRVADAGKPVQYTVQKHDTLGKIAQRFLGSSKRTDLILAANKGRISDPDDIRAGMVLSIPAR
ncbi:MAG: LysM peptidoglycan-binding domain-containing protein [Phycisphaerales bacterium]|nr:LysM peptidoglycan-binding domain-containing protein [Phycisphaerales bacterium]